MFEGEQLAPPSPKETPYTEEELLGRSATPAANP
jgi:hypothetical protein